MRPLIETSKLLSATTQLVRYRAKVSPIRFLKALILVSHKLEFARTILRPCLELTDKLLEATLPFFAFVLGARSRGLALKVYARSGVGSELLFYRPDNTAFLRVRSRRPFTRPHD
jgi:hypothetical protein